MERMIPLCEFSNASFNSSPYLRNVLNTGVAILYRQRLLPFMKGPLIISVVSILRQRDGNSVQIALHYLLKQDFL